MLPTTALPDHEARSFAEATFDRNVVVLAGAGTGKTTLLVNRIVHALMREPHPYLVTDILALTFTNKAAAQMKQRLRERLTALGAAARGEDEAGERDRVGLAELRGRYQLSASDIAARAGAALHDLEKAQIGTLHSFAAHVLRLHPLESGVDPAFREDEGDRFARHFREQWDQWICGELGPGGTHHARWRPVLAVAGLESVRDLARALASELVSLEDLRETLARDAPAPPIGVWLDGLRHRAAELRAAYEKPTPRKVESQLAVAQAILTRFGSGAHAEAQDVDPAAMATLRRGAPSKPTDWPDSDFAEARGIIRAAQMVLDADDRALLDLVDLLGPFAEDVRNRFVAQGWMSFDGLLARARRLLRDHPPVRERLKQTYKTLLIDEFQDTDPVQYEVVLYLAEESGRCRRGWDEIALERGKLFIVGDPKQSIYAFRRADIEAFHRVVNKIEGSGGVVCTLVTNFRSDARVLKVVNAQFDRLFQPQPRIQPQNVHLQAEPARSPRTGEPGVELRLVARPEDEEDFDAAAATRAEAEALARWLHDEVLGRTWVVDETGREGPLRPGHVAWLFRKLTQAQDYLEALRRHGIAYVTEGEKHFYRRQEVVDLVNLLRVLENPRDAIALVGVLRSPLGGLTDRDIYELSQRGALDPRQPDRVTGWQGAAAEATRHLYDRLAGLAARAPLVPLPEVIDEIFVRLPILELAAASLHGEQAVANLHKVRRIALELADRRDMTLSGFVDDMRTRLAEQVDEGEEALGEPSLDAVQVLTIHKAKGLEFPVVVLPGLHQGGGQGTSGGPVVMDWSSGAVGLSFGGRSSLGSILVAHKARAREEAERRRVLYVGMTRARERLVLSAGLPAARAPGRFLSLLEEAGWPVSDEVPDGAIRSGPGESRVIVQRAESVTAVHPRRAPMLRTGASWSEVLARWEARTRRAAETRGRPGVVTPSSLGEATQDDGRATPHHRRQREDDDLALRVGALVHRVLERWDFSGRPEQLARHLLACSTLILRDEPAGRREEIRNEARALLDAFVGSPAYAELSRAELLGREVPFIAPRDDAPTSIVSGTVDVLYRLDGRVWVGDYKTDRVPVGGLRARAEAYRPQMQLYRKAVAEALGLEKVGGKLIFLRQGQAVEMA